MCDSFVPGPGRLWEATRILGGFWETCGTASEAPGRPLESPPAAGQIRILDLGLRLRT